VQDQQVELLDAELAHSLLERVPRLVIAVVGGPYLRLDEDLGTVQAGPTDPLADLALIAIGGRGVDVPVADPQRLGDGGGCLLGRRLKTPRPSAGISTWLFSVIVGTLMSSA